MAYSRLFSRVPTSCEATTVGITLGLVASVAFIFSTTALLERQQQGYEPVSKSLSSVLLACAILFCAATSALGGYLGYWAGRGAGAAEQQERESRIYRV